MSSTFLLTLKHKTSDMKVDLVYLSTTPCRQLTGEYGLMYTEDYRPFGANEFACFEEAVNEFKVAKEKYAAEMVEAKEMALKAVAPESFMERYDEAKSMYDWAVEEYDAWVHRLEQVRFATWIADDNKDWELEYFAA